ncbi:MAG: alkaline phosphatase [Bdellovibrionaceae bacterium]|nr:alkaline phosphatase [Halobacteriovorax sp.]MBN20096.1 alkaline phosphatase [Pseudobdellovibrionaceae bacterium]
MEAALEYINANAANAPYIIFGLLLLAGFNVPVSEDIMLFTSALLAAKNPELLYPLFIAVFAGAYLSDVICYAFMGRFLGEKIFKIKFFKSMAPPEKIAKVTEFYEKYGIITLILGRFIPFGVRNALFLTAGLGKMNALKFCISDFIACTISCLSFFSLYYYFGESVIEYVKKFNLIIFAVAIVGGIIFFIRNRKKKIAANNL